MTDDISSRIPHLPCSWSSLSIAALASALFITLAGCASTPTGSSGYAAFVNESVPVVLAGKRPAAEAAQCFEEQATFLPLSEFSRDAPAGAFTYRLRVAGLWFEQVRITADGDGSRSELRVASNLDAEWRTQLDRDRVAPLNRCLGR